MHTEKTKHVYDQEIKFIFNYKHNKNSFEGTVGVPRTIEITIDGETNLPDLVETFEAFIKAMGYYPPENSHLDWVDITTDEHTSVGELS